jgi:hypothetical protein
MCGRCRQDLRQRSKNAALAAEVLEDLEADDAIDRLVELFPALMRIRCCRPRRPWFSRRST